MREILFRGKRLDNGQWVYGYLVKRPSPIQMPGYGGPWYIEVPPKDPDDQGGIYNIDPSTVGQYTGLTDKRGKKIFEGDIVLKRTYNGKRAFPVTFTEGMFHAGYGGGSSTATHGYTLDDRQIEVIGNKWDNPELLEAS